MPAQGFEPRHGFALRRTAPEDVPERRPLVVWKGKRWFVGGCRVRAVQRAREGVEGIGQRVTSAAFNASREP